MPAVIDHPDLEPAMERLATGLPLSQDAFQAVWRAVFAYCYRRLSNADDAAETAQEALADAHRKIAAYDLRMRATAWVFGFARIACMRMRRTRSKIRKQEHSFSSIGKEGKSMLEDIPEPKHEARTTSPSQMARLLENMKKISAIEERAVRTHYLEGMTFKQAAEQFNCSESAVSSACGRGVARLRAMETPIPKDMIDRVRQHAGEILKASHKKRRNARKAIRSAPPKPAVLAQAAATVSQVRGTFLGTLEQVLHHAGELAKLLHGV